MRPFPTGNVYLLEARAFEQAREVLRTLRKNPAVARSAEQTKRSAAARNGQNGEIAVLGLYGLIEYGQTMLGWAMGGTDLRKFGGELDAALRSSSITSIVIHCDSPGGTAEGVEELADTVLAGRAYKPIIACIDPTCCSAAYWIASACDEIAITPSGTTGSVGVYILHFDYSEALAAEGVKPTILRKPENKASANQLEPLSQAARSHLEREVDQTYSKFVRAVAAGRGVKRSNVEDKYGAGFAVSADDAKRAGMVDRVEPIQQTMARLAGGYKPPRRASSQAESPLTGSGLSTPPPSSRGVSIEVLRKRHARQKLRLPATLRHSDPRHG
jgi:signal peptide peptidase SppA